MGAWTQYVTADGSTSRWYKQTDPWTYFPSGSPRGYGCIALKRELLAIGFGADGFGTESPVIGSVATKVIKQAQESFNLTADGVVGPMTAEAIFRTMIQAHERMSKIPDRWVAKIVKLESAEDPGATGWADPDDHGLAQINVVLRGITVEQAHNPSFAIPYLCRGLVNSESVLHDWDAAVVSWNTGLFWAGKWLAAGKPNLAQVLASTTLSDTQKFWFGRAAHYIELVQAQTV